MSPRLVLSVVFALFAFAANSLFCRLALGRGTIDAATFMLLRLGAGAVTLLALTLPRRPRPAGLFACNVRSVLALFGYAVAFSLAYRQLAAGTGALLLFGATQLTMLGAALARGERPRPAEWLGLGLAFAGLVYLVSPGLTAPAPLGSALMLAAGLGWGIYTLRGRNQAAPLVTTTANFVWVMPLTVLFWFVLRGSASLTVDGATWAVLSGAVSTGLGYVVWYSALPALTATRAATVQLTVPVIAAFGGVAFLGESITPRLVLASTFVLGGVGLAIFARNRKTRTR